MSLQRGFQTFSRLRLAAVVLVCSAGIAQAQPNQAGSAAAPGGGPVGRALTGAERDPVIGSVDGRLIYLSDLARLSRTLPESMRNLPFDTLMPPLLDRMIDHEVLAMTARRAGLDRRPDIQREMRAAADMVLESAFLAEVAPAKVTDGAIEARYNRLYANRPATDQVRARHILVGTEQEAKAVLADLKKGADFATLARALSKDPDGRTGGDLGFFRRDQVWPGFADAAFTLQPGQIAPTPVHNEFGWHVLKVEERRLVAPPTLSEIREQLRQQLTAQAVQEAIQEARSQMIVHKFNLDGSEIELSPQLRSGGGEQR
ncbi:MAG: peptidylprolyl isomerase [Acetobacteraceae bacterium]|nr:peptidylprolyl isomerase [Acetobacteraceae bacterium]